MTVPRRVDDRVLGRILLLQSALHSAPDETRLAEMVARGLADLSGITGCIVCIGGRRAAVGIAPEILCQPARDCRGEMRCRETSSSDCPVADQSSNGLLRCDLDTPREHYGALFLAIDDADAARGYDALLGNTANFVALQIENDRTTVALQQLNADLDTRVTERTRSLRKSEAFVQAAFHDSDLPTFVVRVNGLGDYVYEGVNAAHERAFGIPGAEIAGRSPQDLADHFGADLVDDVLRAYDACVQSDRGHESEHRVTIGGRTRWWQTQLSPVRDRHGKTYRLIGMAFDITERREAERALQASEAWNRSILRAVPVGIGVVSDRVITEANERLCDLVGRPREELIGRNPRCLYPTDDDYEYVGREEYRQIEENGTGTVETRFLHADGRILDVILSSTPMDPDDHRVGVTFSALDITQRKNAERQLAEQERFVSAVIDTTPALVYVYDLQTESNVYCGASVKPIMGYSVADVRDLGAELFAQVIHPDDLDRVAAHQAAFLEADDDETREIEFRLRHADGSWRVLHSFERVFLRNDDGAVRQKIGVAIDVTERRQLEERLRRSERLESIGRLAGGVAHDFNNLLVGIMNYVELCQDDVGESEPVKGWLGEIAADARRSAELTRQLLAFARRQTIAPRILDLNTTVGDMTSMIRRLIGEDIRLMWAPASRPLHVNMDPSQVDQILTNLCVNARDAMEGAGGRIDIATHTTVLSEADCGADPESEPGPYAILSIGDNGEGMDETQLKHLFEPFFTTKAPGEGTGLGLATVYGIVRQNHGFIQVHSEPGKGTTFRVHLPRFPDPEAPSRETVQTDITGGDETILIVEDERSIRVTTQLLLQELGYTVLVAEAPGAALDLAGSRESPIDLLITDVVMPGMNSRDLAARLSEMHPGLKVIFMSGYTADVIADKGILDGDVHFLSKPFTRDQLAQQVRRILELHEES